MRQSTRLILNTGATYVRMGVTVGIGLATTALALRALGETDLGVYGVMFAAAGLGMIASDSLAFSAQRQMTVAIGRGDPRELHRVLATVLSVVLALGAVPLLASLLLGGTIVGALDVPEARHGAAWWALQCCMIGFAGQLLASPFKSLLLANQEIVTLTCVEIGDSVLRLLAAVAALLVRGPDCLIVYAAGTMIAPLVTGLVMWVMCARLHPVSRVAPGAVHGVELKELLRIASWDVLLQALWRLRMQGGQVLLNVAFGPIVNSANTIANQAAGYQNNFAFSISRATHPAIVAAEAARDRRRVHHLVLLTSKYMMLAMTFMLIPLVLQTEIILRLWLKEFPPATPMILRLTAVWVALNYLAAGHMSALYATGRMAGVTIALVIIEAIGWAGACVWTFALHGPAWGLSAVMVAATAVAAVVRAGMIGRLIELPLSAWFRQVVARVVSVAAPVAGGAWAAQRLVDGPFVKLAAVLAVTGVLTPVFAWTLALDHEEREHFLRVGRAGFSRVLGRAPRGADKPEASTPT